jgi:ribonuclease P protein component
MVVKVKREFRLTRSTDFERVRQLGKSFPHPLVVLVAAPNQLDQARVGIAAGRSVGGAVVRNRAKRLLRAGIDSLIQDINPGWDLILLARRPLVESGFLKTRAAIEAVLLKARLLAARTKPV